MKVFYIGVRSGHFRFIIESRVGLWCLVEWETGGRLRDGPVKPRHAAKGSGTRWGPGRNMVAARRRDGRGWTEKEGRDRYRVQVRRHLPIRRG